MSDLLDYEFNRVADILDNKVSMVRPFSFNVRDFVKARNDQFLRNARYGCGCCNKKSYSGVLILLV